MCGRFTYKYSWKEIHDKLSAFIGDVEDDDITRIDQHPARYNIAPTQPVIAIWWREGGGNKAGFMRWGLVPHWVKDPQSFPLIINARVETILEKPAFRGGLRHHRCIVPASGYYEWQAVGEGAKIPRYITRANGEPLLFAGVWSSWMGPEGEEIDTFAIITTRASRDMKWLHDRMPAIIEPEQMDDWLNVRAINEKQAFDMLRPLPEGALTCHPVSRAVNSVRNDGPELIRRAEAEAMQPKKTAQKPAAEKKPAVEKKPRAKKKASGSGQLDLF